MAPLLQVLDHTTRRVLRYLHYAYPTILLVFFLAAFMIYSAVTAPEESTSSTPAQTGPGGKPLPRNRRMKIQKPGRAADFSPARKSLFKWLSVAVLLTFVANAVLICIHALVERESGWWCGQDTVIYVVASFFIYGLFLISLIDTKPSPTTVHWSSWLVAIPMEIACLGVSAVLYSPKYQGLSAAKSVPGTDVQGTSEWDVIELLIDTLRVIFLLSLAIFYAFFALNDPNRKRKAKLVDPDQAGETTTLLDNHQMENGPANGHAYGSVNGQPKEAWSRPDKIPPKGWWEYIRGYSLFFPYLWPAKSLRLKLTVVACFMLVVVARAINLLVPRQVGVITNALAGVHGDSSKLPWGGICLYIFYRLLQGNNGLLGAWRATLWVPISQYSYQELSVAAFEHVHGLSLDFHLGKKTGEVLSALSKGNSINTFLEQVTFQVVPMLVDLGIAIGYFLIAFDAYYALVIAIVTFVYLYITIRLAQWRADIRREMVNFSRQEDAVKNDSMVSYETVKYFNAESYEFNRYRQAVKDYQNSEYKVLISLNIMNVSQNMVFTLGLMITCFIAAYQVTSGQREVGDFTTLITYMAQLQVPLNFFGTFYRSIQFAMINSERMLELFKEKPTVVDDPDAKELPSCQGEIRYNDVKFSYDRRKPALSGVTFRCTPGTTTALVGESGGGKSTIFRLLFRFYNCEGGSIQIDGHDARGLTLESLRRHIGVVPQDTVLFNESIMYNLKYARPDASDEEVYSACRAASIHDKILTFPDGYSSRVGERGLKLSGGEKQRVAIARTILKDPRIILLDEATAALDSETEQNIQEALTKLSQGRTSLVIAHRLSTITNADQILVLHAGKVAECGTHNELLEAKGQYANMWRKQIRAQKAAEEAKVLTDRAEQLRNEAQDGESPTQSDEESGGDRPQSGTGTGQRTSENEDEATTSRGHMHGHHS